MRVLLWILLSLVALAVVVSITFLVPSGGLFALIAVIWIGWKLAHRSQ